MSDNAPLDPASPSLTAGEIAEIVGGEVHGDSDVRLSGIAPIDQAGSDSLGLLADRRYLKYLESTEAGALMVSEGLADAASGYANRIVVPDAHSAMAVLLGVLYPVEEPVPGIHPTAVIGRGVRLGYEVTVAPYAVIEDGAEIGDRVRIGSHVSVGKGCRIGDDSILHPQVVLYPGTVLGNRVILHSGARIGVDGFGYVFVDGQHRKVPQVGGCVIEDDVEIGANTCIDRGSIGMTRVGQGTKLDNIVHLAHNVQMGPLCLAAAMVGIAGSTRIGKGVMFGGQAGLIGHLEIGDGAQLTAQAGVTSNVGPGEVVTGYPARPNTVFKRATALMYKLPELFKRVKALEREVGVSGEQGGEVE